MNASVLRPLIAGNWKMNGLMASVAEAKAVADSLWRNPVAVDVAICPPFTLIASLATALRGSILAVGSQDCHFAASGAFTGDISAPMLADAGATMVILGHSERRALHNEKDADVSAKVDAAVDAGLKPLICLGESFEQRHGGRTLEIIEKRLKLSFPDSLAGTDFVAAYEPFWAIGTGLTPTLEQIAEVHIAIREILVARFGASGAKAPILYGGSVKPENAAAILKVAEVGGALVGGASLKAADFLSIIRAI